MSDKQPTLWKKDEPGLLRKPKELEKIDDRVPSISMPSSTLNPNASEWFPTTKNTTNNTNSGVVEVTSKLQDRLKIHRKPSRGKHEEYPPNPGNDHDVNDFATEHYNEDMKRLLTLIDTLNKDPGHFDNLLEIIMETVFPYLSDVMAVTFIAQVLVKEAINNPNFRYTSAKLCWCIERHCPEFRAELSLRCQSELDDVNNLQNTCLFIAELYTQLPYPQVYGSKLINAFHKLFAKGNTDDIKCICQALKLTGYSLEKSNKSDLDEVIKKLEEAKSKMSGSVLALFNSVLQLRQSNWGHTEEANETEDPEAYFYEPGQNTIIYQTEGNNILSNEESDFIAANFHSHDEFLSDDVSDPDDLCDPEPEMDEEIQEAFKEFVKLGSK